VGPAPGDYPVYYYSKPLTQNGYYSRLKWKLSRLHKTYRFDLVNAHLTYPAGFVGLWFRQKYHVPLIITPHGGDIFYRSRFRNRPRLWNRIQNSLSGADAVIALSGYFQTLIGEIAPTQKNIMHIGNGVNNRDFELSEAMPRSLRQKIGTSEYMLAMGRLVPRKGFDVAIRAFAEIHSRYPDVSLVLAGDGNQRNELEEFAQTLQLSKKVVFLGSVIGPDKIHLFRNAKFVLVPSVEEDNMPLVTLESLACGKPVLGSRLGGIPDVIREDATGILAPPGDSNEFAKAMEKLLQPGAVESLQGNCLQTARNLDWEQIAQKYLRLFEISLEKNIRNS